MLNAAETTSRLPNNRLHGREIVPALTWNDGEILERASTANGKQPTLGTAVHAKEIIALFTRHALDAPTYWAVLQWVRRKEIPDRWRPTVVYMLMRDQLILSNRLFRKAATAAPIPANPPSNT